MAAAAQFHVDQARVASDLQAGRRTDTTRLLCAAAHLDEAFCNRVITETLDERHRAVGPSHGVHLPTVIRHCLAARKRRNRRDALITMAMFAAYATGVGIVLRNQDDLPLLIPLGLVSFFVVWSIVFWEMWYSHYRVVARTLSKRQFRPEAVNTRESKRLQQVLAYVNDVQDGNTIVYSGFSPFVGSGDIVGSWSFSLNVEIGKRLPASTVASEKRFTPIAFNVSQLYNEVKEAIYGLRIPEVNVADRLYVHGQEIRADRYFLAHPLARPYPIVSEAVVSKYKERPASAIRYYQCIEASSWNGDLITSVYLRFVLTGCYLFAEANYLVLSPLKEEYRVVDSMQQNPSWHKQWSFAPKSLLVTLKWMLFWWVIIFSRMSDRYDRAGERRRMRAMIKEDEAFDYGAVESIRERESSGAYRQYFQKLDTQMYMRTIEKQVFDAITEFLDEHDIDTSELKSRQEMILNSGVIMTGGSIQTTSMAVGQQAVSNVQQQNGTSAGTRAPGAAPS